MPPTPPLPARRTVQTALPAAAAHPSRRAVLQALLLGAAAAPTAAQPTLTPVTLQLKGRHGFSCAGFYAAEAQGYYRAAGLSVTLQEARPGTDVVRQVGSGQAQFGVGTSSLLLARHQGAPVVVLAVLQQHSPLVLAARETSPTQGVHDLVGRRVMIGPQDQELVAYLVREGVPLDWLQRLPHSRDAGSLVRGEVDAMSGEVGTLPYQLEAAGLRHHLHTPRAAGIDFYGDNLFTSEAWLAQRPALVKAFREASLRGWRYAMDHPEEMVALIDQRWPPAGQPAPGKAALRHEAQRVRELMQPDLVEIGYMYPGRWQHIAEAFAAADLLPPDTAVEPLLYTPGPRPAPRWLVPALGALAGVSALALYIAWINRRLAQALQASQQAAERLRQMAQHDVLTGLPNRVLFSDRLQQALAASQRDGHRLALLFIDLDRFKPVNDAHGHAVGDALLRQVAARLQDMVRASDTVARLGGDEFVVLLRTVDTEGHALAVADKLAQALAQPFEVGALRLEVSASIGVALAPLHGEDERTLARRADLAMYRAKQAGRDRVCLYDASDGD